MVRKPAVRVGDVRASFHQENLGLFIQPAQARRTGRAARYSANDDDFHRSKPIESERDCFALGVTHGPCRALCAPISQRGHHWTEPTRNMCAPRVRGEAIAQPGARAGRILAAPSGTAAWARPRTDQAPLVCDRGEAFIGQRAAPCSGLWTRTGARLLSTDTSSIASLSLTEPAKTPPLRPRSAAAATARAASERDRRTGHYREAAHRHPHR
jgi:hypothetical protein